MSLGKFAKKNWPVLSIFFISCAAALWFAASFALDLIYFNDPRHKDEALKPWMTPRYVVMSYDLPREVVADALNLGPRGEGRVRLSDVADELGITLDDLTLRVRDAAAAYRREQQ